MVNWHELAGLHGFFEPGCDFSTEDLAVPSEELFVSDSAVDPVTTLFSSWIIIFHHFSSFFVIFHHFSSFFIICHHFSSFFIIFHHVSSFFMCSPGLTLLRSSQEFSSTSQFWFVFRSREACPQGAPWGQAPTQVELWFECKDIKQHLTIIICSFDLIVNL